MSEHLAVAVLGTGIMGSAMARSLCRAGHDVRVWNRTPAKAEALAADGARVAATAAEAVTGADVVLTVVYDGAAVRDAFTAAAPGLGAGTLWLQSTTVGVADVPALAALAADHGVVFFDAPVLGTKGPAEAGQLAVLAAGPEEHRDRLDSVLDAIGRRTLWLGEDGASAAATRLKLVANGWTLTLINGAAEALALAKGLGADPRAFLDLVSGGPVDAAYLHIKAEMILDGDYTTSFSVNTGAKDARLIIEAAEAEGVHLDVVAAIAERFRRAKELGHGDKDLAASYFASFDE
ncbi:NAD(P)-dependent oxidoreductase [Streptomyces sp. NPDC087420]|uniref:NAD(P)-dependent oxidoreductase n=1 Tax=Streptomyces sp. NPDC087420 TaxID=3365785 RepID=UPI003832ABED